MCGAPWPTAPRARKYAKCSCRSRSIAACRPAWTLSVTPRKCLPNWTRSSRGPETMLKDKWALVTGATAGLGLAVAESLAGAGANIVLHDLHEPVQTRDRLDAQFGIEVVTAAAYLSQRADIEHRMARLRGRTGA